MESAHARPGLSAALAGRGTELWLVVLVALVADVASTACGLALSLGEANPVAALAIAEHGLAGMVALKAAAVTLGVVGWLVVPVTYARVVPLLLAVPWGLAASVNAGFLLAVLL